MSDLEAEIVELRAAIARIEGRLGAEQPTEYSGDPTILE